MFDLVPLRCLPVGTVAQVGELVGPREVVHRLEELGLRIGAEVEIVQSGETCMLRLNGQKLCFRCGDDMAILVRTSVARDPAACECLQHGTPECPAALLDGVLLNGALTGTGVEELPA